MNCTCGSPSRYMHREGCPRLDLSNWPELRANGAQKPLQSTPHQTDTRHAVRLDTSNHGENLVLTPSDK